MPDTRIDVRSRNIPRGLVLWAAVLFALSATLYAGGHAHASAAGCMEQSVHHAQTHAGIDHAEAAPCQDESSGDGGCCVAATGCGICATLPEAGLAGFRQDGIPGVARFSAPAPAHVGSPLRPPRPFVTA